MSRKIKISWDLRSIFSRSGWARKSAEKITSTPVRCVTMQEDDLDHLGMQHQMVGQHAKRSFWNRWR